MAEQLNTAVLDKKLAVVENPDSISAAKRTEAAGAVLTNSKYGGRHSMPDGTVAHYPAEVHRRSKDPVTGEPVFYGPATESHLTKCLMLLEVAPQGETAQLAEETLTRYKQGEVVCCNDSMGGEIEGTTYKRMQGGEVKLHDLHMTREGALADSNPELMSAMIERATGAVPGTNGDYPATPAEFARALAQAGTSILHETDKRGLIFVPSSVAEAGSIADARTNMQHPYVDSIAHYIMLINSRAWDAIPESAKQAYIEAGGEPEADLLQDLIVPFNAYHSHQGTQKLLHEASGRGVMDPRSAYVRAYLLHTPAARVVENMMANTTHFYGSDLGANDVRKVIRYALYSTHGSMQLPATAQEWIDSMEHQLRMGQIHSIGRFPESAQHSTCRVRPDKMTIESTSAPQHPDYRMMLAWSLYTKMLDPFAQEALAAAGGDEARAVEILQEMHPWLFTYQSAKDQAGVGQLNLHGARQVVGSAYSWDHAFNAGGWQAEAPGLGMSFGSALQEVQGQIIERVSNEYPEYFEVHGKIVSHMVNAQLRTSEYTSTIEEWLGVERGVYQPNGRNVGVLTDTKRGIPLEDIVAVQAEAFRLQTQALAQVRDERDVLDFYGIY